MIEFDLSRRPTRPAEWVELAGAIFEGDAEDESYWLEFKSEYVWSNRADLGNLSRAIIAMANRDPIKAAAFLGGSAVIAIGLEPSKVHGVERIDPADLDSKLTPYLGVDGPGWEARWVEFKMVSVLLIEVYAPKVGDAVFSLRQSFGGKYAESQVFVREQGRSVPASPAHFERLARRSALVGDAPRLDVEVGFTAHDPIAPYFWDQDDIDDFIHSEKERLLGSLRDFQRKTPDPFDHLRGPLMLAALVERREERRSAEDFLHEVEQYCEGIAGELPELLHEAAATLVPAPVFWISNLSVRNYSEVEVSLSVDGLARAEDAPVPPEPLDLWSLLPSRPRRYGPYEEPSALAMALNPQHTYLSPFRPPYSSQPMTFAPSRRNIWNGGSFRVELDGVDLRPNAERVEIESQLVVLIPIDRIEPVTVKWHATASNVDAEADGSFVLPLPGEPVNVLKASLGRA